MIEKLKGYITDITMIGKIDELVDAVNELQISANRMGFDKPKEDKQADLYAEQRRWIGKLCRFWCTNKKYADLGILQIITPANTPNKYLKKDSCNWFPHCEPVSPDDDIIYKKEQQ